MDSTVLLGYALKTTVFVVLRDLAILSTAQTLPETEIMNERSDVLSDSNQVLLQKLIAYCREKAILIQFKVFRDQLHVVIDMPELCERTVFQEGTPADVLEAAIRHLEIPL